MRKRLLIVAIVILILLVALAVYLYFSRRENPHLLTLYGNVDVRQVDIAFRVAGRVDSLCFEEGDVVKEGDLVAFLDKTPYDSQLEQSLATWKAVQVSFENAATLLNRRQELIGIAGVSQEDLDNATSTFSQLQANLIQAEAAVQVAKDNLSYTEAYAPTSGIVLTRIKEPGSVVNPTDPVITISIDSPIWIRAFVSEPDLGRICYGMEANIHTDTQGGPVYKGKIGFISPIAEFTPKTVETTHLRTDLVYRLRIYVDDPTGCLKQGMPVTVKIPINE